MVRWLTFIAVLCAVAMVAAQAPPQQNPAPQTPPSQEPAAQPSAADKANKVTYTGCLKQGTIAGTWTLENAQMASTASAQAKPGESAVGTSGAAGLKKTFILSTKSGDDLKPHANHKIEVVGVVTEVKEAPESRSAPAGAASIPPRPTLNVDSFKMVSATCP